MSFSIKISIKNLLSTSAAAMAALWIGYGDVSAQSAPPIHLESKDQSISLRGTLIEFDGQAYIIATEEYGTLRVEANVVTCMGVVCPHTGSDVVTRSAQTLITQPLQDDVKEFGIYGSRTVGTTLIPNLLKGYANSVGANFEIIPTDDPAERVVKLTNADGSLFMEVDLQTRGSGSAFPALAEGKAMIGVADRRMKDSDVAKLAKGGIPDLRDTRDETVLGVDGIVMITHPDNPVRNLSGEEVAKIFSGEITNWLELGGGNYPINLNSFGESSGDRAVIMDALVRPFGRDEKSNVVRWSAYQDMVDAVMADRGGMGYVGRWLARTNDVNVLDVRENCGLISPPTDFRMKIEGYSLSRRLYAYTPPAGIPAKAQAFLDWTLTQDAQAYVKESHFIDRELERMRLQDMGRMLVYTVSGEPEYTERQYQNMMTELRDADRLSVSFRFKSGSSELDVESVRGVEELAERIKSGELDGMEVLLVGFADSVGGLVLNTDLAQRRADTVNNILSAMLDPVERSQSQVTSLSYGEMMPLSCNDWAEGRARNRRVEVWLRRARG